MSNPLKELEEYSNHSFGSCCSNTALSISDDFNDPSSFFENDVNSPLQTSRQSLFANLGKKMPSPDPYKSSMNSDNNSSEDAGTDLDMLDYYFGNGDDDGASTSPLQICGGDMNMKSPTDTGMPSPQCVADVDNDRVVPTTERNVQFETTNLLSCGTLYQGNDITTAINPVHVLVGSHLQLFVGNPRVKLEISDKSRGNGLQNSWKGVHIPDAVKVMCNGCYKAGCISSVEQVSSTKQPPAKKSKKLYAKFLVQPTSLKSIHKARADLQAHVKGCPNVVLEEVQGTNSPKGAAEEATVAILKSRGFKETTVVHGGKHVSIVVYKPASKESDTDCKQPTMTKD